MTYSVGRGKQQNSDNQKWSPIVCWEYSLFRQTRYFFNLHYCHKLRFWYMSCLKNYQQLFCNSSTLFEEKIRTATLIWFSEYHSCLNQYKLIFKNKNTYLAYGPNCSESVAVNLFKWTSISESVGRLNDLGSGLANLSNVNRTHCTAASAFYVGWIQTIAPLGAWNCNFPPF